MRGHIRKRGAGYQIVVDIGRDPITNKRKQKSIGGFKTKKEAEKALAQYISKIEKGEYFEAEKISLKEFLDHWLETYAKVNVAPKTFIRYKEFCNTINNYIGHNKLNQIKPAHIQKFYSVLIDEGRLSNSTILKIHRMLHLALKHAVMWQMIINNPTEAVTAPRVKKTEMSVWDSDTANKFLNDIKETPIYIPTLLALTTGMRQGEICALKWDNINFSNGTISVVNSLQRLNGKLVIKPPKTDKSIRNISLMDFTIKELKEHRKKQLEYKLLFGENYQDENFVCAWEDGRPMDPHYVSSKFAKLVKQLNYPKIRFHDLRHTHATMLLQQGVNPKIVQERLGHSQVTVTLDIYSHVLPNMQKEAVQKLESLFQKKA